MNTNKILRRASTYKKRSQRKITILLVIANIGVLTLLGGSSSGKPLALDQKSKERIVSKHFALKTDPIEIAKVTVKAKDIRLGEAFEEEADWLKHLVFHVKNKSHKAVVFTQIDLDFPETKETGGIMRHQMFFGQRPDFTWTLKNPILNLAPNEEKEISLESEYSAIKKLIELRHSPIESIKNVVIVTGETMFEDGTLYSGGFIYRRNSDPKITKKWLKIS